MFSREKTHYPPLGMRSAGVSQEPCFAWRVSIATHLSIALVSFFVMSNILSVFNPPPSRDLSDEECLGCTALQSVICFTGGGYFLSSLPFKDKNGLVDLKKHPAWFQRSVRGVGIGLIALAMYRLGEVGQIIYKRKI